MEFKVGQMVLADIGFFGKFVGTVESVNPTHSRNGREYDAPMPALGLDVEGMEDTLWVPQDLVTVIV